MIARDFSCITVDVEDDALIDRIETRMAALNLSARAVSMLATGKPDIIRDMRRKGYKPKFETIVAIADALETTAGDLLHGKPGESVVGDRRTGYDAGPQASPFREPLKRDLPVFGTALGTEQRFGAENEIETHLLEMTEEIDWVRRPPLLNARRDVYALYVSGHSMEPRFEPGDPVIVDPKRAARLGDDVIVQLTDAEGDEVKLALIKRLVRRTATMVELRQYNPDKTFSVPLERIKAIHRVLMMRDLIG